MENNNIIAEDSWDDIDLSDLSAQEEQEEEVTEEPAEEDVGAEGTEADQQAEPEAQEETDFLTLKYMGEEKKVGREEAVSLAQKGMNYDKIQGQLETAKERLKEFEQVKTDLAKRNDQVRWLEELAKEQGVSLDDLIETTQVQVMHRKTGKDLEVCKGIVANQRKAAELEAARAQSEAAKKTDSARDADITAFMKAYPEISGDPKNVPQEVWDAVKNGESLLNAYRAYEVKQLKAQLEQQKAAAEAEKRKAENKSRSTGSQKTGGTKQQDSFDAAWYDGN